MTSHAENTKRIAKNTVVLYVRMLFSMLVSLYTSRLVLNTLGIEDYGIYNVVGGFVAMFSLISGSLSASVSRFLTFELGKGDKKRLQEVFSTSLLIHIALACAVFCVAESIGLWFLNTQMAIPDERIYAANWVFQASVLSFMFGLFSTPYNASIVSHERMSAFAYIGIMETVLRLLAVLFLAYSSWNYDRLIVYALLLVTINVFLQCIYLRYCRKHFEECRLRLRFNKKCWKEMSSFAGWNFIGGTAELLKDQGVNILLNLFVGPVINAARGLASSVNMAVNAFVVNFMTALRPQITKSYAAGDKAYAFNLVERGSRFSFYILFILALPILLDTEFVLKIWLKQYPEHTVNFVRLILLVSLCDVLSHTLINLQSATGKIRNYQLAVGGMYLMNFPFSYICLKVGFPPECTLIVALVISVFCLFLRLFFLHSMTGLSVKNYLCNVCVNVVCVSGLSMILPLSISHVLSDGWGKFILIILTSLVGVVSTVYYVGCSGSERQYLKGQMRYLIQRYL